jgi:hypothetical protein
MIDANINLLDHVQEIRSEDQGLARVVEHTDGMFELLKIV